MIYAITGHTQGIGKALFERLSPNVIGFSRSTGYNINSKADRSRIIEESKDCDIFINNAYSSFGQVSMLIDLFLEWKDLDKKIINVGSRAAEHALPKKKIHLLEYSSQKKALKVIIPDLQGFNCKVDYKWFGYVGTENILKKYPNFSQEDYITLKEACDIILS
jgi:NADP-dependent 3-hydroxy acid dehydrogenase YdfG